MSSSRIGRGVGKLGKEVLLHLARQLGPALDRVDGTQAPIEVRDVVRHFARLSGPTPCEVRHAILGLLELGWIGHGWDGNDPDLLNASCSIVLRIAGLMAARKLQPKVGVATGTFELVLHPRSGPLDARFSTGVRERDKELNQKGSVLAAFYALACHLPSPGKSVALAELVETAELLAVQGIKARGGPTGSNKLGVSSESLATALRLLRPLLPGLRESKREGKGNASYWSIDGAWPNVVVRDAAGEIGDWQSLVNRVKREVDRSRDQQRRRATRETQKSPSA